MRSLEYLCLPITVQQISPPLQRNEEHIADMDQGTCPTISVLPGAVFTTPWRNGPEDCRLLLYILFRIWPAQAEQNYSLPLGLLILIILITSTSSRDL